jgi:hypothetical protein
MYQITNLQRTNADRLGVSIRPSTDKGKKIDVFKEGKKITSIGAKGYKDYSIHLKEKGKTYADERKRLYKIRHERDISKIGSRGYYANKILWS